MPVDRPPPRTAEEVVEDLLSRSGEPFASVAERLGFDGAVRVFTNSARRTLEAVPEAGGELAAQGIRDEGALWLVGTDAERVLGGILDSWRGLRDDQLVKVAACVFASIAYRHPYFDGNKRTAFLAAVLIGRFLGLSVRPGAFEGIENDVIDMTAREAPGEEVARWLLTKVFISHNEDEELRR